MNSDIKYHLSAFGRRLPVFLITCAVLIAIALGLALFLPTVYSTRAVLLIESAQIPGNLAASTVQTNAPEQLQIIQQRTMTRATLIDLARKHNVYENIDEMSADEIVNAMRRDTNLNGSSGKNSATFMSIGFKGRSAQVVANVVNDYVTRILDENVRLRTSMAEETLDFFKKEVERLSAELDVKGAKILEFQNAAGAALPTALNYQLQRQTSLQGQYDQLLRDKAALQDQRQRLIEVFQSTGQLSAAAAPTANMTPEQRQLVQLQDQLVAALAIYSEQNPKVKVLRARIEQLEASIGGQVGVISNSQGNAALDAQLAQIDSRIATIDAQIPTIQQQLEDVGKTIDATPGNSITLQALQRDFTNIQQQYNTAVARLSQAATGERIELLSKGQRITIIEQAVAPTEPASPNRPLIAVGGVFGGLAAGFGLVMVLEFLDKSIRRPTDLTKALGITPLASIPYMHSPVQASRRRMVIVGVVIAIIALIVLGLYFVQTQVMPLDLVWTQFMERLGL